MYSIYYKDHLIEFQPIGGYTIKKDDKILFSTEQPFPSLAEAEVNAKIVVNRLEVRNDGWFVS